MEESTRQNLVMAFSNVVRTSALAGVVDLQRASMGFGALLERDETATEFDLAELHTFLVEQGGPVQAVDEVCVFLKSREGRFGLVMHLPPHLAGLDEAAREAIVQTFTSRGATSGTRVGRTPISGTISPPQQTGTTPKSGTWEPPKDPKRAKGPKPLYVVFGVLVVLGAINLAVMLTSSGPQIEPLAITDPSGLPCARATVTAGTVMCFVDDAFVVKTAPEALAARGAITKSFIVSKGHRRLLVLNEKTNKVLLSL